MATEENEATANQSTTDLEGRITELEGANKRLKDQNEHGVKMIRALTDELMQQGRNVGRLRDAMKRIALGTQDGTHLPVVDARAALASIEDNLPNRSTPKTNLLVPGEFTSHSGLKLPFKIDCDALTDDDIAVCAQLIHDLVPPFSRVEGVPNGGLRLARALQPYASDGPLLIVDDVWTTGVSMNHHRSGRRAYGAVIFARGLLPSWVSGLFTLHQSLLQLRRATWAETQREGGNDG